MGLGSSSTRKININNPEPPPKTNSDAEVKDTPLPGSKDFKFLEKKVPVPKRNLPLSANPILGNNHESYHYQIPFKNNKNENISNGLDKEDFNRMYSELERYFSFTNEHSFRDYEVPCKKIKVALTTCLTTKTEKPLSCGEEVSKFVSCLLKCKSLKNV